MNQHYLIAKHALNSLLGALLQQEKLKSLVIRDREAQLDFGVDLPTISKNLILKFEIGGKSAKFSKTTDKKNLITIYIDRPIFSSYKLKQELRDCLLARQSSFIHEFIHFLDFENKPLTEIFVAKNEKENFTHPSEIKAYLYQGLHELICDLENTPTSIFNKKYGNNFESFQKTALKFFHPQFLKHSSDETKKLIKKEIQEVYNNK